MTEERKHSKYSASGAERWTECQGSVALSEGQPDVDTPWSLEGTLAHTVLETVFTEGMEFHYLEIEGRKVSKEMLNHVNNAARFVWEIGNKLKAEVLFETRIHLKFIHPEMFGTFDAAVLDYFGTLHVFDYKYGQGHAVNPGTVDRPNLQMLFYGLGLAKRYHWNFLRVRLWIIQPRIKGYDGPVFLDLSIHQIKKYVGFFKSKVALVEKYPDRFKEGSWCHWCKAKKVCPLKMEVRQQKSVEAYKLPVKR